MYLKHKPLVNANFGNSIVMVYRYGFLFNCMTMGQTSDSLTTPEIRLSSVVWCRVLVLWPTLRFALVVVSHFLSVQSRLDCFSVMMHHIS